MATSTRPRADAARNRERLVTAARELMNSDPRVPLEKIAAAAGVGIGTLYRNFPSRDSLLEAAYRQHADEMTDLVQKLVADAVAPAEAMRRVIVHYMATSGQKAGLKEAIVASAGTGAEIFQDTAARSSAAIGTLLAAGQADGTFRTDVEAEDVRRLIGGLCAMCQRSEPAECACGCGADPCNGRLVGVVLDGLRPHA
ncbi:TetR/AcrR family transcriptional regulator [Tsukamurella sp. 8F]|uniref:TetR/AcrR family transcriptional regulator n=1 Tax=unclassified Tsukamurella TaxID=2633480 RepID=UPI0023B97DCA|nr:MULTISPECIES: TetR/AcrR family transcriptional regulator [unclassified Tsukamurella]MDF0528852.1 TetR/AcrR family transcriptional regulator [Tsukamurella sp. 8J]MDF0586687.1 TetR/AcrR family transcriptional regulator [Tsukamurella sp. 8F]